MAGSEQDGPDGAAPTMFECATWVLTPTARHRSRAYESCTTSRPSFGPEVLAVAPIHHDALVAS
jgi:prephenate dehydrogenase